MKQGKHPVGQRVNMPGRPLEPSVHQNNAPCPFCTSPPDHVLIERPLAIVKRDGYPLTKGHALVIPRRRLATFFETTKAERQTMLDLLDETKALLDREHQPDGYNIGINSGPAAGQTIMHVHLHINTRYLGDRSDPRSGIRWIFPEKAAYWSK